MSDVVVVARCASPGCPEASAFDPVELFGPRRDWPAERAVSNRFRCRCGGRAARLGYAAAPASASGRVYLFG